MKNIALLLSVLLWVLSGQVTALAQDRDDTLQGALEYNRTDQSSTWVNPDTGDSGQVIPVRTFQNAQGLPCREFQQTIMIGGREEQGYGTACRQPDGTWRIVAEEPEVTTPAPVEQRTTVYVREVPRPYYDDPYGYYAPWGYRYPYGFPFSFGFSLGYIHHDGGHHHGGHRGDYYRGGHHGGHHR